MADRAVPARRLEGVIVRGHQIHRAASTGRSQDPARDAIENLITIDVVPEEMVAVGIKLILLNGRANFLEEGVALLAADERIAPRRKHQCGHSDMLGQFLRVRHQAVKVGEKFQGVAADAVRNSLQVFHVIVIRGEARQRPLAVDETHRLDAQAREDPRAAAHQFDGPARHRCAQCGHRCCKDGAGRPQRAVSDRIDCDQGSHAFADDDQRGLVREPVGEFLQIIAPRLGSSRCPRRACSGSLPCPRKFAARTAQPFCAS